MSLLIKVYALTCLKMAVMPPYRFPFHPVVKKNSEWCLLSTFYNAFSSDGWNSSLLSPSWASLVAQRVKHLPTMQETWVRCQGGEDPLEKEMTTHSSILAWRIPWTEEPGGLQSTGSQRVRQNCTASLSLSPSWGHLCSFMCSNAIPKLCKPSVTSKHFGNNVGFKFLNNYWSFLKMGNKIDTSGILSYLAAFSFNCAQDGHKYCKPHSPSQNFSFYASQKFPMCETLQWTRKPLWV